MTKTPSGLRPHIVILGKRNVGKSSLLNAIAEQPLAIVSDIAGTTTDPVKKPYELLPFGPVVFIDTAGLDDEGQLGMLRIAKTRAQLAIADYAILVVAANTFDSFEQSIIDELISKKIPFSVVVNKIDEAPDFKLSIPAYYISAKTGENIENFRNALVIALNEVRAQNPSIISDIVSAGDLVILVVPIDLEAPKGRLILPQVTMMRDILDNDACALIVKERELFATLQSLGRKPNLVITDSQVVFKVVADVPNDVPLTTFSILFARLKGDLAKLVEGVKTIDKLADGDKILIAEACSHHSLADDIGGVKIPRWIRQYTGADLFFEKMQGQNFPDNIDEYDLVVHCGGCMLTSKGFCSRIDEALTHGVPITNYGIAISYVQGVLLRALSPFPEIAEILQSKN